MKHRLFAVCAGLAASSLCLHAQTTGTPATAPAPSPTPAPTSTTATPAAPAAPAAPTPPSWSGTFQVSYVNQYMFRGQRLGGDCLQPEISESYGNWSFDVWNSDPLANKVYGQSDPEIDPQGSYTFALNDSWSIIPGFTWYTYVRAPTNDGFYRETFEPNIAVNYTVGNLKLAPEIYYDMVLKGPTYEFDAYYTIPLKSISSEIDLTGTVGTYLLTDAANNVDPKIRAWGNYYLIGGAMPFQLSKVLKLTVGYAYTQGTDAVFHQAGLGTFPNTSAVGRGVVTITLAASF